MIARKHLTQLALILILIAGVILLSAYGQDLRSAQLYRGLQQQLTETGSLLTTGADPVISVTPTGSSPTDLTVSSLPTTAQPSLQTETETGKTQPTTAGSSSSADAATEQVLTLLNSLNKENPDIIGWIRIPGTNIDYPVVLGEDNRFYLDHDINRDQSRNGSIFMDYRNNAGLGQKHTILYGHHTRDHTMFTDLMKYKVQAFSQKNTIIEYYTRNRKTTWKIFAAYVTAVDFYYIQTIFPTAVSFSRFLESIRSRSKFSHPVDVTPQDQILTLSTCTYEFENARFVVHAVLIDDTIREKSEKPPEM